MELLPSQASSATRQATARRALATEPSRDIGAAGASSDVRALISFLACALGLAFAGVLKFEFWSQVTDLWDYGITFGQLDASNVHRYRYLVALPGFHLEQRFGPVGISAYVGSFVAVNCWLWIRLIRLLNFNRAYIGVGFIGFVALQMSMNGRGVFAWTAWLAILFVCAQLLTGRMHARRTFLLIPLALLLATVSTGVFAVVFGTLVTSLAVAAARAGKRRLAVLAIGALVCSVMVFGEYFLVAITKNLAYFGGIGPMLGHGLGRYLLPYLSFALLGAAILGMVLLRLRPELKRIALLALPPLAAGMFGITVLTLVAPPLLLVIESAMASLLRKSEHR